MNDRQRNVAGICVGILSVCVGACDRAPADPREARKSGRHALAIVGPVASHPAARHYRSAVEAYQRQISSIQAAFHDPLTDSAESLEQALQAAIATRPSALVVYVGNAAMADAVTAAADLAAVAVSTFGPVESSAARCGHVYIDYPAAAELLGRALTTIAGGGRSYLLLHRESAGGAQQRMFRRFIAEADRASLRRLDTVDLGQVSGPAARNAVDELLRQFPYATLVVTLDPSAWLEGPERAMPDGVRFATLGAFPELWPALRAGNAAALAGPWDGAAATEACKLAYEWVVGSRTSSHLRVIGSELVTKENLDEFEREYHNAAGAASRPAGNTSTR